MHPETPLRAAWSRDAAQQHDDIESLVANHTKATSALEVIKHAAIHGSGTVPIEDLATAITTVGRTNSHFDGVLKRMVLPKYFNSLHDHRSPMTAAKLFDVAEITEMVCLYLPLPDVLAIQQVNKRFYAIVEGSGKLQTELAKLPLVTVYREPLERLDISMDKSIQAGMRFPRIYGSCRDDEDNGVDDDDGEAANARLIVTCRSGLWTPSIKPGARIRRLLVLSPTLTEMRVEQKCCFRRRPNIYEVENKDGVTIGDLYDINVRIQMEHARCPYAPAGMRSPDGIVRTSVVCRGSLPEEVAEGFRERMRKLRDEAGDTVSTSDAEFHDRHMDAYRMAKQAAFEAGLEVPTLAEFEASQVDGEDAVQAGDDAGLEMSSEEASESSSKE